jgi:hypothetical protein
MNKWMLCGVGLLLVALPACLYIPVPEGTVLAGSKVTSEMTALIRPGVTTRSEVIHLLGEPALDLSAHRIIAYNWEMLGGHMPWGIGGLGLRGAGGVVDVSNLYVLLIAFDADDRVLKFEETTQPLWDSVSEHALRWGESEGLVSQTAPTPFVARVGHLRHLGRPAFGRLAVIVPLGTHRGCRVTLPCLPCVFPSCPVVVLQSALSPAIRRRGRRSGH